MNKQPTQEQITEFWKKIADEWESFSGGKHYHFRFGDEWYRGEQSTFAGGVPIIDLNNLFKYAVPKLIKANDYFMMCYSRPQNEWYCQCGLNSAFNEDPALALFWALWQVKEATNVEDIKG